MSVIVRDQLRDTYRRIVDVECRPGMSVKQMDTIVGKVMGGYPAWRVRAIRLGEAGCCSAAAYHKWIDAFRAWEEKRQAHATTVAKTERARQAATDRELLRRLRDQTAAELQRITTRLALLDGDTL